MAERSDFATDTVFRQAVSTLMDNLLEQLDEVDADIDPRLTPGSLSVTYEDGTVLMLSQQTPTHELWLSANYTAWHFVCSAGQWVERDSGEGMYAILSSLMSAKLAFPVTLAP